jgi:peptidoglycan hydrolase CwlO-like protein
MKKSITLAALLLVLGTSVFATTTVKADNNGAKDEISFVPLKTDDGFGVKIDKETTGKSYVIIYDINSNVIFKDVLSKGESAIKGYVITSLETGDYTVEVASKGQSVKKQMHVYEQDNDSKSYFFYQN